MVYLPCKYASKFNMSLKEHFFYLLQFLNALLPDDRLTGKIKMMSIIFDATTLIKIRFNLLFLHKKAFKNLQQLQLLAKYHFPCHISCLPGKSIIIIIAEPVIGHVSLIS